MYEEIGIQPVIAMQPVSWILMMMAVRVGQQYKQGTAGRIFFREICITPENYES